MTEKHFHFEYKGKYADTSWKLTTSLPIEELKGMRLGKPSALYIINDSIVDGIALSDDLETILKKLDVAEWWWHSMTDDGRYVHSFVSIKESGKWRMHSMARSRFFNKLKSKNHSTQNICLTLIKYPNGNYHFNYMVMINKEGIKIFRYVFDGEPLLLSNTKEFIKSLKETRDKRNR